MSLLLYTSLILGSIWLSVYALFFELQRSAVDLARANLFDLRSKLFEVARRGDLSFNSSTYRMHRELLNGMIRYSEDISISHMIISKIQLTQPVLTEARRIRHKMDSDVKRLTPSVRKELAEIFSQAHNEMVMLMINRSVMLTALLRSAWCVSLVFFGAKSLLRSLRARQRVRRNMVQVEQMSMSAERLRELARGLDRVSRTAQSEERFSESRQVIFRLRPMANESMFRAMRARMQAGIDRNAFGLAPAPTA